MQWNVVVAKSCGCSRSSLIIKNKRVELVNVFLLLTMLLVMCFITMNLLYKQSFADPVRVMLDDLFFGVHDFYFFWFFLYFYKIFSKGLFHGSNLDFDDVYEVKKTTDCQPPRVFSSAMKTLFVQILNFLKLKHECLR